MVRSREEAAEAVMEAFRRDPELAVIVLQRTNALVVVGPWQRIGDNWMRLPVATASAQAKALPRGWFFSANPKTAGGQAGHVVGRVGEEIPFAVVPSSGEAAALVETLIRSAAPDVLIAQPGPPPGVGAAPAAQVPAAPAASAPSPPTPHALPQYEPPTIIEAPEQHVARRFQHPVR